MREVIWFGPRTPEALIQCSTMDGTVTPPARCTQRAWWGVVTPLEGGPNYRLVALCNQHMEMWTRSQHPEAAKKSEEG